MLNFKNMILMPVSKRNIRKYLQNFRYFLILVLNPEYICEDDLNREYVNGINSSSNYSNSLPSDSVERLPSNSLEVITTATAVPANDELLVLKTGDLSGKIYLIHPMTTRPTRILFNIFIYFCY